VPPNRAIRIVILAASLLPVLSGTDVLNFSDSRCAGYPNGEPAKPRFLPGEDLGVDVAEGHFRGDVSLEAERAPNLAGHYTLTAWTCGSGCSSAIVVDSITGRLYRDMPFDS
jgi:hypothetical protein